MSTTKKPSEEERELLVIDGEGDTEGDPAGRPHGAGSGQRAQFVGEKFRVPYRYELWYDGVYQEKPDAQIDGGPQDVNLVPSLVNTPEPIRRAQLRRITDRPMWIEGFARTIDTKEELICIGFSRIEDHAHDSVWVSRVQLSDRKQLETLAAYGLPIRTGNATDVETYFSRAIGENAPNFDWDLTASRCGMYPRGDKNQHIGFLRGDEWIGPAPKVVLDPRGSGQFASAFYASGDHAQWDAKFREIAAKNATCNVLLHSAFTSPIMRLIEQRSFIMHHWGMSSSGKTALLRLCMSVYGDPIALTSSFNATAIGAIEIFRHIDNLPIAYDELQASTNKEHATLVYNFVQEKGRRRAKQYGGLAGEVNTWRTMIRTTGEEPLVGNGKIDFGGQRNRVIEVNNQTLSSPEARDLHHWLGRRHFGHAGRAFLSTLTHTYNRDPGFKQRLYDTYQDYARQLDARVPGLDARADPFAAIVLAGRLAGAWIFGEDPKAYGAKLLEDAVQVASGVVDDEDSDTIVDRALTLLREHAMSQPSAWINVDSTDGRARLNEQSYSYLVGVFSPSAGEVWLIPTEANKILRKAGMSERRIWTDLRKEGSLQYKGSKRAFGQNTLGQKRMRNCHVLQLSRFFPAHVATQVLEQEITADQPSPAGAAAAAALEDAS